MEIQRRLMTAASSANVRGRGRTHRVVGAHARTLRHLAKRRGVVGCIDGTHISIPCPSERYATSFFNYKHFFSVVLLAIVDQRGKFRWCLAGAPGACSDAGLWNFSDLKKAIEEDVARPASERLVLGEGKVILGDSAFAENDKFMRTPYGNPSTRIRRFFNYSHSSHRFRVEHSFGRLKLKFQALKKGLCFKREALASVIEACVALYNFIIDHEGLAVATPEVVRPPAPASTGRRAGVDARGQDGARDVEAEYLPQQFLHSTWGAPNSFQDRQRQEVERDMRRRRCR